MPFSPQSKAGEKENTIMKMAKMTKIIIKTFLAYTFYHTHFPPLHSSVYEHVKGYFGLIMIFQTLKKEENHFMVLVTGSKDR